MVVKRIDVGLVQPKWERTGRNRILVTEQTRSAKAIAITTGGVVRVMGEYYESWSALVITTSMASRLASSPFCMKTRPVLAS